MVSTMLSMALLVSEQTRKELGLVQEEAKQTLEDGEKQIADLKMSLISMEKAYEAVLKVNILRTVSSYVECNVLDQC